MRQDLDGLIRSRIQNHGDAAAYVCAGSEPSTMRELFDSRERAFFGQADPLMLGRLPTEDVLTELGERFRAEQLDPGEALGELALLADGHPQRVMLLSYLLAERLERGELGSAETAGALCRTRSNARKLPIKPRGTS